MDGFRSQDQDAGMPLEESVNSAGGGYISHISQNRLEILVWMSDVSLYS